MVIQMLNLLLTPALYTYTENCTMAKNAWESIISAFEDSGIGRRVDLLKQLVSLKQDDCTSMEEYVHKMVLMANKVKKAGPEIGDEVVAALMLAGLPDEYRPMVMAIENSTPKLSSDFVQNRLLQEVTINKSDDTDAQALISKRRYNNNNKKKQQQKSKSTKSVTCCVRRRRPFRKQMPEKETKRGTGIFLFIHGANEFTARMVNRFGSISTHDNGRL